MATLQERLDRNEIIILDGAVGTELERRGVPISDMAWCATAMKTHPVGIPANRCLLPIPGSLVSVNQWPLHPATVSKP